MCYMSSQKAKEISSDVSKKMRKILTSEKLKFVLKNKKTILALIYMISPIDIIPDAVPVVGVIDDAIPIIWAMCDLIDKTFGNEDNIIDMPEEVANNVNTGNATSSKIVKLTDSVSKVKDAATSVKNLTVSNDRPKVPNVNLKPKDVNLGKVEAGELIPPKVDIKVKDVKLAKIEEGELSVPKIDFDDKLT